MMINSLEEAIKREEALTYLFGERYKRMGELVGDLPELEAKHKQYAEWLRELKAYKDFENKGYVMCRFEVAQDDRHRTTKMVLDFSTKESFDNVMEVNTDEDKSEMEEFVSKRKLKEAISKMEELKKEGNSFAECADECIKILQEVII